MPNTKLPLPVGSEFLLSAAAMGTYPAVLWFSVVAALLGSFQFGELQLYQQPGQFIRYFLNQNHSLNHR